MFFSHIFFDYLEPALTRLRLSLLPPLPTAIEFTIPDKYSFNMDGERFMLQDFSNQKRFKRLLLFASDRLLDILFRSEWIFIDGTFKAAPLMFTQLVCIVCVFEGEGEVIVDVLIF